MAQGNDNPKRYTLTQAQKKAAMAAFSVLVILAFPMLAMADTPGDGFPATPDAPIDGGLSLLVAAGVGYGAKKLKERKAKKENII